MPIRGLRYASESHPVVLRELAVPLTAGRGSIDLDTSNDGSMRVTAAAPEASASLDFYLGSWGWQPAQGMRVDRVELVPDRERYRAGDKARVTVRAPFPGKLLLTIQREKTLWTQVVDLAGTRAEVAVPVDAAWAPNVYCAATVIRAVKKDERWATDASGKATAAWVVPEFDGALRVMAVAAAGDRYGCGEAKTLVRESR